MLKITALISVAIIFIGLIALGYWYAYLPDKENNAQNTEDIPLFFGRLKETSGLELPESKNTTFRWVLSVNPELKRETLSGQGFSANEISTDNAVQIETFFKDNGFKINQNNVIVGRVSGLVGYEKGNTVCVIAAGFSGYKEAEDLSSWEAPNPEKKDVDVRCGNLTN